jgi:alpha-L-fucosidase
MRISLRFGKPSCGIPTGPKRDLLGELNEAGRKRGLKTGIYYSFYEWWHPLWLSDREGFVSEQLHPRCGTLWP